jgi:hypothetical protein
MRTPLNRFGPARARRLKQHKSRGAERLPSCIPVRSLVSLLDLLKNCPHFRLVEGAQRLGADAAHLT